ncbi:MAG: thioesterase family protein [Thermoguttaceae bacterium]
MSNVFQYPHVVTQDEIDEQGHANNVVYVGWMQDAAVAHSATLGWTAQRYLSMGKGWVARSHKIEYLRPAYAGDEIVVETRVVDMKKVTSKRLYRIVRRHDGELLATAETHWAFVNYTTGRPTRIPEEIIHGYPLGDD